jgi:hypothetical protein
MKRLFPIVLLLASCHRPPSYNLVGYRVLPKHKLQRLPIEKNIKPGDTVFVLNRIEPKFNQ